MVSSVGADVGTTGAAVISASVGIHDGTCVGMGVGGRVGSVVGRSEGEGVGGWVGAAVGVAVGSCDGAAVGRCDGSAVGWRVGSRVGSGVGTRDGAGLGACDGSDVVGCGLGAGVGASDGGRLGACVAPRLGAGEGGDRAEGTRTIIGLPVGAGGALAVGARVWGRVGGLVRPLGGSLVSPTFFELHWCVGMPGSRRGASPQVPSASRRVPGSEAAPTGDGNVHMSLVFPFVGFSTTALTKRTSVVFGATTTAGSRHAAV